MKCLKDMQYWPITGVSGIKANACLLTHNTVNDNEGQKSLRDSHTCFQDAKPFIWCHLSQTNHSWSHQPGHHFELKSSLTSSVNKAPKASKELLQINPPWLTKQPEWFKALETMPANLPQPIFLWRRWVSAVHGATTTLKALNSFQRLRGTDTLEIHRSFSARQTLFHLMNGWKQNELQATCLPPRSQNHTQRKGKCQRKRCQAGPNTTFQRKEQRKEGDQRTPLNSSTSARGNPGRCQGTPFERALMCLSLTRVDGQGWWPHLKPPLSREGHKVHSNEPIVSTPHSSDLLTASGYTSFRQFHRLLRKAACDSENIRFLHGSILSLLVLDGAES